MGQLGQGSRGGGSVLLYSTELQQQGLVAVNSKQARILESWGNGTNTEVHANRGVALGVVHDVQSDLAWSNQKLHKYCACTGSQCA
jgi:hypothetical protein